MGFKNIKSKLLAERGFTIVELLIVIVVIGILATITIVAYNGVTARANKTSAQATASSVIKKIEAYNAEESKYPLLMTELTAADQNESYFLPASINFTSGVTAPDASNGTNTVRFLKCTGDAVDAQDEILITNVAGASIGYWDFVANAVVEVTTGDATDCPAVAT